MALIKLLPFILIIILIIYEDRISNPSCKLVPGSNPPENVAGENGHSSGEDDLKVMIVSNLLLLGSEAGLSYAYSKNINLSRRGLNEIKLIEKMDIELESATSAISLNSVPLLCGDNSIRFSVEKTVETESTELQKETEETELKQVPKDVTLKDFSWRENALSSGSGPVLLLHMPLHLRANNYQDSTMYDENPIHWDATRTESR
ncbi:hypothetical protein POM88_010366 [Heracleum sosnowskyi]|uniref:Uncharacterized protein n=1 Tax=Heracleum sosnowskyi TaxID=360622 RepID=A0AAD8IT02_9APIA|nr:hypothetical protein POM88_010366 [Heracleum sosnowskyi]